MSTEPRPADGRGPVLLTLIAGLLLGLTMVIVVPPFQVPDEPQHFYRAFALAEGRAFAGTTAVGGGSALPESLPRTVELLLPSPPTQGKFDSAAIRTALALELDASRRVDVGYPGASVYFPHVYLPQALGIAAGRLLGAGPLVLLYLGRLAGLLGCLALLVAAVHVVPAQRWTFAVLALTPMAIYLRSAVTADAMTISLVFLSIALFVREASSPEPLARAQLALLALVAVLTALAKPSYAVVSLLFFAVPRARFARPSLWVSSALAIVVVPALLSLAWNVHASAWLDLRGVSGYEGAVVDPEAQARLVLRSPGTLLAAIGHTLSQPKLVVEYCRGVAGYFGWLDTKLSNGEIAILTLAVLALACADRAVRRALFVWQKAIVAAVFLAGLVAIFAALYVTVTPPGARRVEGMQGRYVLPLLPLVVLPLQSARSWGSAVQLERARPVLALLVVLLSAGLTLATVIGRFH